MYMRQEKDIISQNIRESAKKLGITKVIDASRLCGFESPTDYRNFCNYWNGDRTPDMPTLKKIANGLKTTWQRLCGEEDGASSTPKDARRVLVLSHDAILEALGKGAIKATKQAIYELTELLFDFCVKTSQEPTKQMAELIINSAKKGMSNGRADGGGN